MIIGYPLSSKEQEEYVRKNRHFFVDYVLEETYTEKVKPLFYDMKNTLMGPAIVFQTISNQFLRLELMTADAREFIPVDHWVDLQFIPKLISSDGVSISIRLPSFITIVKQTVGAKPRQLAAGWAVEAARDLVAHGLDAEEEIAKIMAQEIANEIDRDIITQITKDHWHL